MNAATWLDLLSQDETKEQIQYVEKNYHIITFLHYEEKHHFNIYVCPYTIAFCLQRKRTPFCTLPNFLYVLDG